MSAPSSVHTPPMPPAEFITRLQERGVTLALDADGALRIRGKKGWRNAKIDAYLLRFKAELIAYLTQSEAVKAPDPESVCPPCSPQEIVLDRDAQAIVDVIRLSDAADEYWKIKEVKFHLAFDLSKVERIMESLSDRGVFTRRVNEKGEKEYRIYKPEEWCAI